MAYKCCLSCYLAFPNYLPKHTGNKGRDDCGGGEGGETTNNCTDKDEKSCSYWANEITTKWCRNSGTFGETMRNNCCKSCPQT
uniref:ShKT domain-containing protein n=1 Tax=Meloidogyne hapla TaxID=6305 RepID=A0A1I8C1D5_MELHA